MSDAGEFDQGHRDGMQHRELVVEGKRQLIGNVFGPLICLVHHDAAVDRKNNADRCSSLGQRQRSLASKIVNGDIKRSGFAGAGWKREPTGPAAASNIIS